MVWYPLIGWGVFWLGLIIAIILYAMKRKWYPIMYLISVCVYVFTVSFVIDAYDLSKNGILGALAFSAAIMISLGFYLSKRFQKKK